MRIKVTRLLLGVVLPTAAAKISAAIFTINTSRYVISQKDVPFGGLGNNFFLYFDHISPQNGNLWPIIFGTENVAS